MKQANWRCCCARVSRLICCCSAAAFLWASTIWWNRRWQSLGARFFFTGVSIQPGKPVVFGEVQVGKGEAVLWTAGKSGLDDGDVSAVRSPAAGCAGRCSLREPLTFAQATLKTDFKTKTGLTRFLPAKLGGTHEQPEVEIVRWQGSGDLMAVRGANCYIVVPPDREQFVGGRERDRAPVIVRRMSKPKNKKSKNKSQKLSHYDERGRASMVDVSA